MTFSMLQRIKYLGRCTQNAIESLEFILNNPKGIEEITNNKTTAAGGKYAFMGNSKCIFDTAIKPDK